LLFEKKLAVWVYSKTQYYDIFNQALLRESEACVRITFPGYRKNADGKIEPNWQIQAVGPQNSIT
jgi:hypothetical protein